MIHFENVSKIYRRGSREVTALVDVTLHVNRGDFVAVRGHSGCGKSTLLSLAGGLALPTSGAVDVDGQRVSAMNSTQRAAFRQKKIGFVFQLFHLLPYLSVLDNVKLAAAGDAKAAVDARARELLQSFGLGERLGHRPGELSIGERQRVAMARALLNEPQLLLADEPTGNLDPRNADAVLDLMSAFHQAGGTVLLVTHDEHAAARASSLIELENGRLLEKVA